MASVSFDAAGAFAAVAAAVGSGGSQTCWERQDIAARRWEKREPGSWPEMSQSWIGFISFSHLADLIPVVPASRLVISNLNNSAIVCASNFKFVRAMP